MGELNNELIARAEARLKADVMDHVPGGAPVGSAKFNLTLINAMDPSTVMKNLRPEPQYDMVGDKGKREFE